MNKPYEGLREKLIELTENSLLCETKERDTELATQIVGDLLHYLSSLSDEKLGEEIKNILGNNITPHSIRGDRWVFRVASLDIIRDEMLALCALSRLEAVKKAKQEGIKEVIRRLDAIDTDADDVKVFTRQVCELIVEYQQMLKGQELNKEVEE